MRLFVAVDLDQAVRAAAAATSRRVAPIAERAGSVNWLKPENMHLTLKFLGEVDDGRVAEIAARVREPYGTAAFDASFAGVGLFPPTGPARVIWIGMTAGVEPLKAIQEEVERRLGPLGFPAEKRPFQAHLTLGRFRVPAPRTIRPAIEGTGVGSVGTCRIDHVTLYQSRLSPRGATYTALDRGPLR